MIVELVTAACSIFITVNLLPRTQLEAYRIERDLSLAALAREVEESTGTPISASCLSRWENGSRHGSRRKLTKVARVVGLPVNRLLAPVEGFDV